MSGIRCLDSGLSCFFIPDLAHQDNVRVHSHNGTQSCREVNAGWRIGFNLANLIKAVLYRVLNGHYVPFPVGKTVH